ncbi:MAG: tetratricopeptide repeat protein [Oscillospiraceae bacterium]|jgi:tetratricopeptide (TPR) repeat protein|nr:tetratricopeptide repeat protein [Oscillospiraceae bacterium]
MKKLTALILALTLAASLFACGKKSTAPTTAAEWLDLGQKYLLDLDFEQAVVAFDTVIRIEPKNVKAYIGLADAYVGLGETDKAVAALRDGIANADSTLRLETKLAEIEGGIAEPTVNPALAQGEVIVHWDNDYGWIEYRMNCVDGVPQPMGTTEENGVIETIMTYSRHSVDGSVNDWRPAPHYWAGLRCTDCGDDSGDEMPKWFQTAFSHAWSGQWKGAEPDVFYIGADGYASRTPPQ